MVLEAGFGVVLTSSTDPVNESRQRVDSPLMAGNAELTVDDADDRLARNGANNAQPADARFSWICQNDQERSHLLAMDRLMTSANTRVALAGVVLLIPALAFVPPVAVALMLVSMAAFMYVGPRLATFKRPEVAHAAVVSPLLVMTAAAIVVADEHLAGGLLLLMWATMGCIARYPSHAAPVAPVVVVLLIVVCELLFGFDTVLADPARLAIPVAVVIAVAMIVGAARGSDIDHSQMAVLDPLTGMLNRNALASKTVHLARQTEAGGDRVAVILGDIDRFKEINDSLGHDAGDHVLREVAYRLRRSLRAFDLAYRLGGEEFVVLAPGSDLSQAAQVAERLREALSEEPIAGRTVTMSFGVAASEPGDRFDWDVLYSDADTALYDAKEAGRNRVCAPGLALPAGTA